MSVFESKYLNIVASDAPIALAISLVLKESIEPLIPIRSKVFSFICYKDGEVVDSCGGFYGSKLEKNGMLENIPEEFKILLTDITDIE